MHLGGIVTRGYRITRKPTWPRSWRAAAPCNCKPRCYILCCYPCGASVRRAISLGRSSPACLRTTRRTRRTGFQQHLNLPGDFRRLQVGQARTARCNAAVTVYFPRRRRCPEEFRYCRLWRPASDPIALLDGSAFVRARHSTDQDPSCTRNSRRDRSADGRWDTRCSRRKYWASHPAIAAPVLKEPQGGRPASRGLPS